MRKLLTLLILFVGFQTFAKGPYTIESVPNPVLTGQNYVSDPDDYLKPESEAKINSILQKLRDSTGTEVAVVMLESIQDGDINDFANRLFNYWGIGQKKKNNGLLMLFVMNPHGIRLEVGYGLEGVLPDAKCKDIIEDEMVPRFKEENYDAGIIDGLYAVNEVLFPDRSFVKTPEEVSEEGREAMADFVIFIMLAYFGFQIFNYFQKKKNCTFKHLHANAQGKYKDKAPISVTRWIIVYWILPALVTAMIFGKDGQYTFCFFMYMLVMGMFIEKRMRANSFISRNHKDPYDKFNAYKASHSGWFFLAIFFPLFFIAYWIYYQAKKGSLRNQPRPCPNCKNTMMKLDEKADDHYLNTGQLLEENIKSVDYDVWLCDQCNNKSVLSYVNNWSTYTECTKCHVRSYFLQSDRTIHSATYSSSGEGVKTYLCKHCNHTEQKHYTIPRLERSSSSSSGGGSSSSSWGGGSSGGGGASSSW